MRLTLYGDIRTKKNSAHILKGSGEQHCIAAGKTLKV